MITEKKEETGVQSAPGWAWSGFAIILVLLVLVGGVRSCSSARAEGKAEKKATADSIAVARAVAPRSVLVLQDTFVLPDSVDIRWPNFRLEWDGPEEFWVQYRGVKNPVKYGGKEEFRAPAGVQYGMAHLKAADPSKPATVRVYERRYY